MRLHHSLALHAAAIPTPDYRTTFFRSVAPGHQTREQLQYSQGHWLPALVPGMPSLENITEDEALHFLGHVGVALDAEHPATPPAHPTLALDDETISVPTGGLSGNVMMFAYGGMGPYRYEVISGSLGGVVHIGSNSGVVLVMTESDTAVGETVAIVRVVDANGDTEDATLTVTVTALPRSSENESRNHSGHQTARGQVVVRRQGSVVGALSGLWVRARFNVDPEHTGRHSGDTWEFDGDYDRPTFAPSRARTWAGRRSITRRCHSFVKNGQWQYLGDCTHDMAGQTVDMIPPDPEMGFGRRHGFHLFPWCDPVTGEPAKGAGR